MKIKTAFFILSILAVSQTAFARLADAPAQRAGAPADKFVRGLEGVVTSPLEYINQYQMASNTHGLVASVAGSVLGGTAMMLKRIINGAYDIVSFPVNAPKDYGLLLPDDSETALAFYARSQNAGTFPLAARPL